MFIVLFDVKFVSCDVFNWMEMDKVGWGIL